MASRPVTKRRPYGPRATAPLCRCGCGQLCKAKTRHARGDERGGYQKYADGHRYLKSDIESDGQRLCANCKTWQPFESFTLTTRKDRPNGTLRRGSYCAACRSLKAKAARERQPKQRFSRARRYGVTPAQVYAMFMAQDGKCAICKTREAETIDHCHATKMVRGLLCDVCNR